MLIRPALYQDIVFNIFSEMKENEILEKLQYAKESVIWLVNNSNGSVDCHGLVYWAGEVERLREEIKKLL